MTAAHKNHICMIEELLATCELDYFTCPTTNCGVETMIYA
jgi:hypothetical protein